MLDGIVRRGCEIFGDGRESVHDEERRGRQEMCSDWLHLALNLFKMY